MQNFIILTSKNKKFVTYTYFWYDTSSNKLWRTILMKVVVEMTN